MLELEGKLADSFHFIGQQIHYIIQFDKTFLGLLFNMLFFKQNEAESRTHQLDQLSSQLHVTFYVRLRNTNPQGVADNLSRLGILKAKVDQLTEKWSSPAIRQSWIPHDFYGSWLDQVALRIDFYNLARGSYSRSERLYHLCQLMKRMMSKHFNLFREQKPFLMEFWYRFFKPDPLKTLEMRLDLAHDLSKNVTLSPTILLMLQSSLYLQAMKFYQENFSDLDKSYMDDINFAQAALEAILDTVTQGSDALPESIYQEFQQNISIKFQHQKDTDWKLQFPSFIECAQMAQQQWTMLAQKNSFFMSTKSRSQSTDRSSPKKEKSKSKFSFNKAISAFLGGSQGH